MPKQQIIFGIHCHQPIGVADSVIEDVYQKNYLPFIQTMADQPKVKFVAHYSGVLFDWFQNKHPEFIELLVKLVNRHQLEIIGGAYYEPILAIIPDQDKLGQLETMNKFIRDTFSEAPRGAWLAERVWEQNLAKILSQASLEYVILDESHLALAGLPGNKIIGYHLTEDEGDKVNVFPLITDLRELARRDRPLTCLMEAGEKIETDYLAGLLARLPAETEFTTFSDYLDDHEPAGRVYPAPDSFRSYLTRYPEANNLHKKMLLVSRELHALRKGKILIGDQEKDQRLKNAIDQLYQGQCGDAYWNRGAAGPAYHCLIEAEKEIAQFKRGRRSFVEISVTDFDKDGLDEAVLSNEFLNLYFAPARGGTLVELDYKPKAVNLLNVLGRPSLMDHFLSLDSTIAAIRETGDFIQAPYVFLPRRSAQEAAIVMRREGLAGSVPVQLEKSVSMLLKQSIINIRYQLTNTSGQEAEIRFAPEFTFGVLDQTLKKRGEIVDVAELKIVDEWSEINVLLEANKGALLWHYPIETKNGYQGAALLISWRFKLAPAEAWTVNLSLRIEE